MEYQRGGDRAAAARGARVSRVQQHLTVALAALTVYVSLGLFGLSQFTGSLTHDGIKVTVRVEMEDVAVLAFELRGAGNGVLQPEMPEARRHQSREADEAAICRTPVTSGTRVESQR